MVVSDPRWVWYGGRPSLDFVNTHRDREGAGVEHLNGPGDLADWLQAADELPAASAGIDADLLADAIELREAINAGVVAAIDGKPAPAEALQVLNRWLASAAPKPSRLRNTGGRTVLNAATVERADTRQTLGYLALDAAQLIGTDLRTRLRICPGEHCGGRFLDDSPAARRRWCSMQVCGNRFKAAIHRKRQQRA
ncbi:CGNR zinc finger domain-containing protein [Dactylosporangium matsuzakiense]|nr:ABATE domain-containing protein [Dactylosporangium matsuzakiense]